jgi:hypothetical protein
VTIPPLAGLFGYEEAFLAEMPVERSAACLWRLAYAYRRLHALAVDVLPRTPEWEVKCALGLRVWLDAEHAAAFERRAGCWATGRGPSRLRGRCGRRTGRRRPTAPCAATPASPTPTTSPR